MRQRMITAAELWAAIDKLAAHRHLSLTALAELAGLPKSALTTENRFSETGELSWPPLPALLQIVGAAGVTLREFGLFVDDMQRKSQERRRA